MGKAKIKRKLVGLRKSAARAEDVLKKKKKRVKKGNTRRGGKELKERERQISEAPFEKSLLRWPPTRRTPSWSRQWRSNSKSSPM